jgi:hypothetical protein
MTLNLDQLARRAARPSAVPPATTVVDPAAIALQVFGVEFSLDSRDSLIAQLEQKVPVKGQTSSALPPSGATVVGEFAPAYLTAQILEDHLPLFTGFKPIDSSNPSACDYRPLIPLITNTIVAIRKELSKPEPLPDAVDGSLTALCGYNPDKFDPMAMTVATAGGLLGDARDRCGFSVDIKDSCSAGDESAITSFGNAVALVNIVASTWHKVKTGKGSKGFSAGVYPLLRNLRAIVLDLIRLREHVGSAAWMTSELTGSSGRPVFAWDLYQWIYDYANRGAEQELQTAGKDAVCGVASTMTAMRKMVESTLVLSPPQSPKKAADPVPCSAIAASFSTLEAQTYVHDLSCHMQKVIDVAGALSAPCAPDAQPSKAS